MTAHLHIPAPRSKALFDSAFVLSVEGRHHESDELLALAHEMRELEYQLGEIASHAPDALAELLIKSALMGFSDEDSPNDYIDANREVIDFYSTHDNDLRRLIEVIRSPKQYTRSEDKISDAELADAREVVKARIEAEPGRAAVTDWTITPAAVALAARGYKQFLNNGRCSILRECPACRSKYSTKVHRDKRIYWHCPQCNTIKEA
jgi:hypothetical protein